MAEYDLETAVYNGLTVYTLIDQDSSSNINEPSDAANQFESE